ncbi:phage baseplate assembly protein V [Teichococcus rhizosphaerae]|uniref:phage baseplate assembly protein V n=1 Tax=Teichococcus rhizosphaerae TaxID=1335062 RepID=UPI00159BCB88|nr:phage baseplate assembly protein V [Pseudoroseomonas rhizosphaerae]
MTSVNPETGKAKLRIHPGETETNWLQVGSLAVRDAFVVVPPNIGDVVLVVPHEGDGQQWIVVSRLFTTDDPPPQAKATGKAVQPGEFAVIMKGGVELVLTQDRVLIEAPGGVYVKAPEAGMTLDGPLHVTKTITAEQDISTPADVKAASVSLRNHRHSGVRGGSDTSGPPA